MNSLAYYDRQKESWKVEELQKIKDEYVTKELSIIQLADIHRRTPGSIAYKLRMMGVIEHSMLAKGYSEYRESNLYKEIIESSKTKPVTKEKSKEVTPIAVSPRVNKYTQELNNLKGEIETLKKDVKEILRLMHAVYDFESAQE